MKRIIASTLIVSLGFVQIGKGEETFSGMKCFDNPTRLMDQILNSSGIFDVSEARRLIFQLKREVKEKYDVDLDLNFVKEEAIKVLLATGNFSEIEIEMAKEFYNQLLEPEMQTFNRWKFGKKKHRQKKGQELILPDKMAAGFVCIFGGTLLCLLPFGITQGIGTGLIGTGIYAIIDGVREGEKPYYMDSGQSILKNFDKTE